MKRFTIVVMLSLVLALGAVACGAEKRAARIDVDATVTIGSFTGRNRSAAIVNWMHSWGKPYPNQIPALVETVKALRMGIIRFASGLWVNSCGWDRTNTVTEGQWTYTDPDTGQTWSYQHVYRADEIDDVAAFAKATGVEIVMQVNIADNNPKMWADLVRYCNIEHDYKIRYWELGNELDYTGDLSYSEYISRFLVYHEHMKAVDLTIKLGAPVTAWPLGHEGDARWYTEVLATCKAEGRDVDFLAWHRYQTGTWAWGGMTDDEITAAILRFDGGSYRSRSFHEADMAAINSLLADYPGVETAITEIGSVVASEETWCCNHISALWLADSLARYAKGGLDMCIVWDLYDGDYYGMCSPDNEMSPTRLDFRSTWYALLMYARYFGDQMVDATSNVEADLSAFASVDSTDGCLKIMVINATNAPIEAGVYVSGYTPISGSIYEMTSPDPLSCSGTNINGYEVDGREAHIESSIEAIPPQPLEIAQPLVHIFPAYSVTAIVLSKV